MSSSTRLGGESLSGVFLRLFRYWDEVAAVSTKLSCKCTRGPESKKRLFWRSSYVLAKPYIAKSFGICADIHNEVLT